MARWRIGIISIAMLGMLASAASVHAGNIVSPHQYAWSNAVGYINFVSMTVGDSALDGYAWSANTGWINMHPELGGVINDGFGNLSGHAWGEQIGWIDFDQVSIDSNGRFTGTATGTLAGTIAFDCPQYCDVQTDWRRTNTVTSGGGGTSTIVAVAAQTVTTIDEVRRIDILKDGIINIFDLNAMMVGWGTTDGSNPADIHMDGMVDIFDFNLLMLNWNASYTL